MYKVYVLYSKLINQYYIGHTENLFKRLLRHNKGLVRSTKKGIPWVIVYQESFGSKNDAYRRELKIKAYKKGGAFKRLLK